MNVSTVSVQPMFQVSSGTLIQVLLCASSASCVTWGADCGLTQRDIAALVTHPPTLLRHLHQPQSLPDADSEVAPLTCCIKNPLDTVLEAHF